MPDPPPEPDNASNNPPPSPPPRQRRQRNRSNGVAAHLREAYSTLGLELSATERDVRVKFRQLSRKYHPDKHQQSQTGLTDDEAMEFFQKTNNAQETILTHIRSNPNPI